jgi:hypothetical protein
VHAGYEYANNYSQPWWGGSFRVDPDDPTSTIDFRKLEYYHDSAISVDDWNIGNYDPAVDYVAAEAAFPPPNPTFNNYIERHFEQGEGPADALIPVVKDVATGINEYWSIFGYNGTEPFFEDQINFLNYGLTSYAWRYTPRPSALRITLRLIDRGNRLGVGWTYQFIVDLPEAIR